MVLKLVEVEGLQRLGPTMGPGNEANTEELRDGDAGPDYIVLEHQDPAIPEAVGAKKSSFSLFEFGV